MDSKKGFDTHIVIRVPEILREGFRDVAESKRRTMSDLLREYMESQVTLIIK